MWYKKVLFLFLFVCVINHAKGSIDNVVIGDVAYTIDASLKTAWVKACKTKGGIVEIKSSVNYKSSNFIVNGIGKEAFLSNSNITSVILPKSILWIGESAFGGCVNLERVEIPHDSDLTTIYSNAFANCEKITNIYLPNTLTTLGANAFASCNMLESISIPLSVTTLEAGVFSNCISLKSVTIPSSITEIKNGAFLCCYSLESIEIPNSVLLIGDNVFQYCRKLKTIVIPESVISIGKQLFYKCESLERVDINGNIKYIPNTCFAGCSSLTTVDLPLSLQTLGESVFAECKKLSSILLPESITTIGNSAFSGCSSLNSIVLPDAMTTIGSYAFSGCSSLSQVTFGAGTNYIGNNMFYYNGGSLKDIYCKAMIPPTCGDGALTVIDTNKCALHVPAESIDLYKNANQWNRFFNIKGDVSHIDAVSMDSDNNVCDVYDIGGRRLRKNIEVNQLNGILPSGIYVIYYKLGKRQKLIIK